MVASWIPTTLIWMADTLKRMDNGEEMLIDKLVKWIQLKLDIYYDNNGSKGEGTE